MDLLRTVLSTRSRGDPESPHPSMQPASSIGAALPSLLGSNTGRLGQESMHKATAGSMGIPDTFEFRDATESEEAPDQPSPSFHAAPQMRCTSRRTVMLEADVQVAGVARQNVLLTAGVPDDSTHSSDRFAVARARLQRAVGNALDPYVPPMSDLPDLSLDRMNDQMSQLISQWVGLWNARERLPALLALYELEERLCFSHGNCQFAAIADQMYCDPNIYPFVRAAMITQLKNTPERYRDYIVDCTFDEYVAKMEKDGEWGDHVTLQASADALGVCIMLLSSFEHAPVIEIQPLKPTENRKLWLSFWASCHYNSLHPLGEAPCPTWTVPQWAANASAECVIS